jgi:hypothetical protein
MAVAITIDENLMPHEDAAGWKYERSVPDGPVLCVLVDEDGNEIGVDAVVDNIQQVQSISQEEYDEIERLMNDLF